MPRERPLLGVGDEADCSCSPGDSLSEPLAGAILSAPGPRAELILARYCDAFGNLLGARIR